MLQKRKGMVVKRGRQLPDVPAERERERDRENETERDVSGGTFTLKVRSRSILIA